MGDVTIEVVRVVPAPIDTVSARLADIEGHMRWMPQKGSIFRATEQTSPGESQVGTTYVDRTAAGMTPGEIVEFEPPTRIVYHWWMTGRGGRITVDGWPGYRLEPAGGGTASCGTRRGS